MAEIGPNRFLSRTHGLWKCLRGSCHPRPRLWLFHNVLALRGTRIGSADSAPCARPVFPPTPPHRAARFFLTQCDVVTSPRLFSLRLQSSCCCCFKLPLWLLLTSSLLWRLALTPPQSLHCKHACCLTPLGWPDLLRPGRHLLPQTRGKGGRHWSEVAPAHARSCPTKVPGSHPEESSVCQTVSDYLLDYLC